MILTCPNCASRFLLSAQVLAPEGRRVKCSSCAEEWFQMPDPDELIDNLEHEIEEIPEAVKPIPEGSSVPTIAEAASVNTSSRKANLGGYAGALVVFVLIFGVLLVMKTPFVKAWAPSAGFYEMFGMSVTSPGEGLVFDRVKAQFSPNGQIIIEGIIINLTNADQFLPNVEATVRTEGGDVIEATVVDPPFEDMKAETSLPFKTIYDGETAGADHVQLKFVLSSEKQSQDEAKTASKDDGNTPTPHADDHAETPDGEAH